jgi:UDP-4-amino-4,6-dideoxy-N-acetyl-beta-L-altrosamine transaminase
VSILPYARQTIEDDDVAAVAAALRDDFLTTGPKVAEFEHAFASATGARYAVACNSGTAALHLAALAVDLGPGDAAIVPTMTFLATANIVRMTGAEIVFADVDPESGLMTPETLSAALQNAPSEPRVKAAIPVHLNGQVCDLPGLAERTGARGVVMIEDACHALGIAGIGAAIYSKAACFSTHPVKAIATGEGGLVTTSEGRIADRMRSLRSHGMSRDRASFVNAELAFDGKVTNPWYYEMHEIGWNYRMPDLLCALGASQLQKLPRFHQRRREIAALYERLLAPLAPKLRPVSRAADTHGWHLYTVLIDFPAIGVSRAQLMNALRQRGIGTQVHYIPVHLQPYYRRRYLNVNLPGAEAYYARCLSIPFYPSMTDADVHRVAEHISSLVRKGP